MFQSTHSRGVRQSGYSALSCFTAVSIHALTRSATSRKKVVAMTFTMFQSTHSRGVRQSSISTESDISCFNPRTHEECDSQKEQNTSCIVFQSTHSRGVRPHIFFLFYFQIFRTRFSRIFLKNIKSKR